MLRKTLLMLILFTGCGRNPEENAASLPAPPPAAAFAVQGKSLDANLVELERALSKALGSNLDDQGKAEVVRAEAITDRLLESRLPFTWLRSTSYSLESQVRQIQALADRVVAEMRSGVDKSVVSHDITDLRTRVISLRRAMAMGGGRPPIPLDSLLAGTARDSTIPQDAGE